MRAPILRAVAVLAAVFAALPACAETYKWISEKGVTTYSNSPPPSTAVAKKLEVVAERISVIPQDQTVLRNYEQTARTNERISQLERELAATRAAGRSAVVAGPSQAAYQRCLADRRVDCDGGYDTYGYGYYPAPYYVIGAAYHPGVFLPRRSLAPRSPARRSSR